MADDFFFKTYPDSWAGTTRFPVNFFVCGDSVHKSKQEFRLWLFPCLWAFFPRTWPKFSLSTPSNFLYVGFHTDTYTEGLSLIFNNFSCILELYSETWPRAVSLSSNNFPLCRSSVLLSTEIILCFPLLKMTLVQNRLNDLLLSRVDAPAASCWAFIKPYRRVTSVTIHGLSSVFAQGS